MRLSATTRTLLAITAALAVLGAAALLLPAPWRDGAVVLAVAAACSLAAVLFALRRTRRHYRRLLAHLAGQLERLAQQGSVQPLPDRPGVGSTSSDLADVTPQLEKLAAAYRVALTEVVHAREQVERLTRSGRGEQRGERLVTPAPTHFVVGSSRHRMVARLTPNFYWLAATPPLLNLLRRKQADLVARSFLDCVYPADVPVLKRSLQEALQDGEEHNITFRVVVPTSKKGRRGRFLQMDVMTCYDEDGRPEHLRCHFLDVSDRIRAERKLRRQTRQLSEANRRLQEANEDLERLKESYRDLYHQAPVLYFSLDPQGNLVAFNETLLRTLGYPRRYLLNQPYHRILAPGSREAYLRDPTVLQHAGEVETRWVKQDGTVIDVGIDTSIVVDEQGSFLRSRSVARDVTERRRLATALREKADELGQANAQLRRINLELEDFTHIVSHDLREPLRALETFSSSLAQEYGPLLQGEAGTSQEQMKQASRRLGALLDDLLTLNRSGRVVSSPQPLSWDEVLRAVRADLRSLLDRRQAGVRVEEPLPAVCGDPERVVRLLTQLIANGVKYNRSERPEVVLGSTAPPPGRLHGRAGPAPAPPLVTLFVRDNGIGIEPAHHEQVFRMFRRLHPDDGEEGTGAGLAICKRIVEAHGGTIWIESQPDQGSTFYFTLPREPQLAGDVAPPPGDGNSAPAVVEPALPAPSG